MKRSTAVIIGVLFFFGVAGLACAQEAAPAPDAQKAALSPNAQKAKDMVQKAVAFYKANGLEATIAAVNDTKGQFVDGEYYIFIHSYEGINIARGDGNMKRLGSNVLESRDPDGKLYVQEMLKIAQKDGFGWNVYGFKNQKTGEIMKKHSYFEKIDGAIVGCGFFEGK